jgi:hypothetical protein
LTCPECGESRVAKQFSTFASSASSSQSSGFGAAAPSCGGGSGFR